MSNKNQLNQALEYHGLGLNTIPCYTPGEELRNGRIATGKEPRIAWKQYQYRPMTRKTVEAIFKLAEQNNIAIIAGLPSKNLLILDFDKLSAYMELYAKNSFFRYICDNTMISRTKRGVHVWIRTDFPVQSMKIPELNLDVQGMGKISVEPKSIYLNGHRIGQYTFEIFNEIITVAVDDLAFLGIQKAKFADANWLGIGYKYYSILKGEKLHYHSRSEAEQAFVLKLVSNGESVEYVLELFRRFSENSHYSEHPDKIRYVVNMYDRAKQYYLENQREFDRKIGMILQGVNRINFRTNSDYAVLQCALQKARECKKLFLNLSIRDLAISANLGIDTVHNSLKRLQDRNFIEKRFNGEGNTASLYKIDVETIFQEIAEKDRYCFNRTYQHKFIPGMVCSVKAIKNPVRDLELDIYTHYGLGKTGLKVLQCLIENKETHLSRRDIVKKTGVSYHAVKNKLEDLKEFLSKKKHGRAFYYRLERDLTEEDIRTIEQRKGVSGTGERRKRQFEQDRELQSKYLNDKMIRNVSNWQEKKKGGENVE